jgi:hypothetical protein
MPFWTKPIPSGCPFPQTDAFLGVAAEANKKSNFIEFYENKTRFRFQQKPGAPPQLGYPETVRSPT